MNNQTKSPAVIAQGSSDKIGWQESPTRDVLLKKKRQFHAMISTNASIDQTQPGLMH